MRHVAMCCARGSIGLSHSVVALTHSAVRRFSWLSTHRSHTPTCGRSFRILSACLSPALGCRECCAELDNGSQLCVRLVVRAQCYCLRSVHLPLMRRYKKSDTTPVAPSIDISTFGAFRVQALSQGAEIGLHVVFCECSVVRLGAERGAQCTAQDAPRACARASQSCLQHCELHALQ